MAKETIAVLKLVSGEEVIGKRVPTTRSDRIDLQEPIYCRIGENQLTGTFLFFEHVAYICAERVISFYREQVVFEATAVDSVKKAYKSYLSKTPNRGPGVLDSHELAPPSSSDAAADLINLITGFTSNNTIH